MTNLRRIPVDAKRADWPRLVADRLNAALAELEFLIPIVAAGAAASIDFLGLEGEANVTGYDGLLLSGDAQVTGADFLLY